MSFAGDEAFQGSVVLFPDGVRGIPRPAWECFEALSAILREPALSAEEPLNNDPLSESIAVFTVCERYVGVSFTGDESLEVAEAILPAGVVDVPHPARQRLEAGTALLGKLASLMACPLGSAPLSEPEAVLVAVVLCDSDVSFAGGEAFEVREAVLPGRREGIPFPTRQLLETCGSRL